MAEKKVTKKKTTVKRAEKKTTPKKLKLLITVVDRSKGEFFADIISQYSVNMQSMCQSHGTASTDMLRYLGLGNSEKTTLFSIIREDRAKEILDILEEKFSTVRNGQGIAFTIPFSSVIGVLSYGFLSDNRSVIKEEK